MVISKVKSEKGFSLVELIVVTAIFVTVLIITGVSFDTIVSKSGQEMKTAETQIEGAVGLEILRRDLAQAGYGLPWDLKYGDNTASYSEISTGNDSLFTGLDSAQFNDAPNPPRAVVSSFDASTAGFNGSDHLVVKSTVTGMSDTAKKWYNATFSHYTSSQMSAGERVIVIKNTYSTGSLANKVLVNTGTSGTFSVAYPADGTFPADFRPPDQALDIFTVYGVAPSESGVTSLRMPFNRSDYYIKRPGDSYKIPQTCAQQVTASTTQGVGILYRSTASQDPSGGGFSNPYPLLDCVADMQVVYSLDSNGDGNIDLHSDTPLTTAAAVRAQVKEVRVYILAQEGKRSAGYTYPQNQLLVGERINGVDYGRVFTFSDHNIKDWSNYHWRLYTIVVPLGNLN